MKLWHILDVGSVWMKEFGSALSTIERVAAWSPNMQLWGAFSSWQRLETLASPKLEVRRFPLQRGYARFPLRRIVPFERGLVSRMLELTSQPEDSPLVCSTPYYAPVARLWPGPVVYYVTDLTVAYPGLNPKQVRALDREMCHVARAVCPNSKRIAEYLVSEAHCDAAKITVVPNATRQSNVGSAPQFEPGEVPEDLRKLQRPLIGVLGDLSGNMDWILTAEAMRLSPEFSWVFVGPTDRVIEDRAQSAARDWAKKNATFAGMKPYGELQSYARCFDVAVLPYLKREPTYSGSSTRFYEHLAAGRPMVATRGFAELLEKVPLVRLADTAQEVLSALRDLQATGFRDGHEVERWEASKNGTWEERARMIRLALANSYGHKPITAPVST